MKGWWLIGVIAGGGCRLGFEPRVAPADGPTDPTIDAPAIPTTIVTFGERPASQVQGVTSDAHLVEDAPGANWGGSVILSMYGVTSRELPVVRFDLASIMPGRRVISARLQLVLVDLGDQVAGSIAAFRLDETWTEGTGVGAPGGGVTWRERDGGRLWSMPGGTHAPDAYGTQAPGLTPIEVSFELPASVAQGWVDVPASNAGLILRVLSDNTHYHFVAREEPVATDHRPQLVVELE